MHTHTHAWTYVQPQRLGIHKVTDSQSQRTTFFVSFFFLRKSETTAVAVAEPVLIHRGFCQLLCQEVVSNVDL